MKLKRRIFKRADLQKALDRYKPRPKIKGKNNPLYKDGNGEPYVRIRVNGFKVKRSHIVWMLHHKKNRVPKDFIIHHKDGNKRNDNITNLSLEDGIEHGIWNLKYTESFK